MAGEFFKAINDQIDAHRKQKAELAQALAILTAQNQQNPEVQAKQMAMQEAQGQIPQPLGGYNRQEQQAGIPGQVRTAALPRMVDVLQKRGVLPKPALSLEDIFAKSQMQAAGADAGRGPSRRPAPQGLTTAISSTANAIARLQELEQFMKSNPTLQTGPHVFQLKRQGLGGLAGNIQLQYGTDPETAKSYTELNKMSNQTQDAYRSAVTGAQAGFPEIGFLQTSIATPQREIRANYETSLSKTRQETQQKLRQMIDALDAAGYDSTEFRQRFAPFFGTASAESSGAVTMQDRSGKTYQIPADRVQEATADGLQPVGR